MRALLAFFVALVVLAAPAHAAPYSLLGENSCGKRDEIFGALRERGGVSLGHYRSEIWGVKRAEDGSFGSVLIAEVELSLWAARDRSEFVVVTSGLRSDPQWGEHAWSCVTARGDRMSPFPTLNPEKGA